MKSFFIKLGIFLLLFLIFGCSSVNMQIQSSMGQPISAIIDRLGPPSRVTGDGRGGSIYVWEQWMYNAIGPPYLWSLTVWTDPNGIIYNWR